MITVQPDILFIHEKLLFYFSVLKMEYNGIKCDANILTEMGKDIEKRVQEIQNEIYEITVKKDMFCVK